jgi:hypothetical protein
MPGFIILNIPNNVRDLGVCEKTALMGPPNGTKCTKKKENLIYIYFFKNVNNMNTLNIVPFGNEEAHLFFSPFMKRQYLAINYIKCFLFEFHFLFKK